MFSTEVPGSNSGNFFLTVSCTFFNPMVTVVSKLFDLQLFGFCNSVVGFSNHQGTAMMASQISSHSH